MEQIIQVDVAALAFIAGTVIPLVTALAVKLRASAQVKSLITGGLSLVSGIVVYLQAHEGATTWQGLVTVIVSTYLAAGVTYQNLWKPSGVAEAVANIAPGAGVGTEQPVAEIPVSATPENIQGVVEDTLTQIDEFITATEAEPPSREDAEQLTTLKGTPVYVDDDGTLFVKVA